VKRISTPYVLACGAIVMVIAGAWLLTPLAAQDLATPANLAARPDYTEPVVLASKNGVLEVTLTAHQGQAKLDTVATPVQNFLVFAYTVERGTASNGETSGDNLYPAPTLQVFPGEKLIVHVNNDLANLTIRDYYNPAFTTKGHPVPVYPAQLSASPFNLHVHGVHVSPMGNSDNVLLDIPANASNTYSYQIPKNMPQGATGTTVICTP
jgi:FtsP/CotA-like multicopper oxidase with cupredoxin domain